MAEVEKWAVEEKYGSHSGKHTWERRRWWWRGVGGNRRSKRSVGWGSVGWDVCPSFASAHVGRLKGQGTSAWEWGRAFLVCCMGLDVLFGGGSSGRGDNDFFLVLVNRTRTQNNTKHAKNIL